MRDLLKKKIAGFILGLGTLFSLSVLGNGLFERNPQDCGQIYRTIKRKPKEHSDSKFQQLND